MNLGASARKKKIPHFLTTTFVQAAFGPNN